MRNILLINTSSINCQELAQHLEELELNVWHTSNSREALSVLHNKSISIIILLAESSTISEKFSHLPIPPHIPVLIIHPRLEQLEIAPPTTAKFCDILQPPLSLYLLQQKLNFLDQIGKQYRDLINLKNAEIELQKKIGDLHRSVDGHNTFIDLMSRRDGLTGLFNRRYFSTIIKEEFGRTIDKNDDLSLLILNIDYFNEINKSCGQEYGDFVLNEFSARITNNTRTEEFCFRYSGENFAILMPSTSVEVAYKKAEELRKTCEKKAFNSGYHTRKVTISIGLAAIAENSPTTHEELINMADQALFIAKSEGRNRCRVYTPIDRSQCGTSEHNFKHLQETVSRVLEKTKLSTIKSLQLLASGIMEKKNNKHIQQARDYAQLLSQQLQLPTPIIETFKNAISLHISIRHLLHNEIINKKGSLSTKEWEIMSDLPYKLVEITQLFDYFSNERSILLYHGEHYDGSGYPEGLQGDEIPLGARIFNLVNALAAMNSDKPHRPKLQEKQILSELATNAGKQFDPVLVLKLIDIMEENEILNLDKQTLDNNRKTILHNNPAITDYVKI